MRVGRGEAVAAEDEAMDPAGEADAEPDAADADAGTGGGIANAVTHRITSNDKKNKTMTPNQIRR